MEPPAVGANCRTAIANRCLCSIITLQCHHVNKIRGAQCKTHLGRGARSLGYKLRVPLCRLPAQLPGAVQTRVCACCLVLWNQEWGSVPRAISLVILPIGYRRFLHLPGRCRVDGKHCRGRARPPFSTGFSSADRRQGLYQERPDFTEEMDCCLKKTETFSWTLCLRTNLVLSFFINLIGASAQAWGSGTIRGALSRNQKFPLTLHLNHSRWLYRTPPNLINHMPVRPIFCSMSLGFRRQCMGAGLGMPRPA